MSESTTVARRTPEQVVAERKPIDAEELQVAREALLSGALPDGFGAAQDSAEMARAIAERILRAETFEEAFAPQTIDAWKDVLFNTPVGVLDFHLNASSYEVGSPFYAVCDVERLADGEVLTVQTGGLNVLAQLLLIAEKGWWGKPVKMISKDTAGGFDALWLIPA